jgi:hypothetical protein
MWLPHNTNYLLALADLMRSRAVRGASEKAP